MNKGNKNLSVSGGLKFLQPPHRVLREDFALVRNLARALREGIAGVQYLPHTLRQSIATAQYLARPLRPSIAQIQRSFFVTNPLMEQKINLF